MIHHINEIPVLILVILTFAGTFLWFIIAEKLWRILNEKHRNYFMQWIYLLSGALLYTGYCMSMIHVIKIIMQKL